MQQPDDNPYQLVATAQSLLGDQALRLDDLAMGVIAASLSSDHEDDSGMRIVRRLLGRAMEEYILQNTDYTQVQGDIRRLEAGGLEIGDDLKDKVTELYEARKATRRRIAAHLLSLQQLVMR